MDGLRENNDEKSEVKNQVVRSGTLIYVYKTYIFIHESRGLVSPISKHLQLRYQIVDQW